MRQPGNHEMDTQVSLVACVRLIVLGSLMWSLTATSVLSTHAVAEDLIRMAIDERVSELTILYSHQPILVYAFSASPPQALYQAASYDVRMECVDGCAG